MKTGVTSYFWNMLFLYHKFPIFFIIHGHIIWIIYTHSLELYWICCMFRTSWNICYNLTWFFSPFWLLLWTTAPCWELIQTHKQLYLYLTSVSHFPSLWHCTIPFQFMGLFPFHYVPFSWVIEQKYSWNSCESEFLRVLKLDIGKIKRGIFHLFCLDSELILK